MKRLWLFALVGTVGMHYVPAVQASAVWTPAWSLDWQFGTTALISNTGRSTIGFTHLNASAPGNATPVLAWLTVKSSVPAAHPDAITNQNYGAYLRLTDAASHASRLFWFSGTLTGTLSKTTASLTNRFNTPTTYTNIRLGADVYTISIGPMLLPNASNHFQGSLGSTVRYVRLIGDPPVFHADFGAPVTGLDKFHPTPEPSGLLLAGLGLALTGLRAWRRRRGAKGPLAA